MGTNIINMKITRVCGFFSTFYLQPRKIGRLPVLCDEAQVREVVSYFANVLNLMDNLGTPVNSALQITGIQRHAFQLWLVVNLHGYSGFGKSMIKIGDILATDTNVNCRFPTQSYYFKMLQVIYQHCMVTGGSCLCGDHSITQRLVRSLCCALCVTLCAHYTFMTKLKINEIL